MTSKFQLEALDEHNRLRKLHGAPPLVICDTLVKSCKEYARQLAKNGTIEYSTKTNFGENIACVEGNVPFNNEFHHSHIFYDALGVDVDVGGQPITELWYNEIVDIDWGDLEKSATRCNNFTQLIWVDSVNFGIGKVVANDKKIYVVARYSPPGNYRGMYTTNVLPLNSSITPRSSINYITRVDTPDQQEFNKSMLVCINRCRDAHAVPKLKWNNKIASDATRIAFQMVSLKENYEEVDGIEKCYGRIVLCSENGLPPVKTICKTWYDCSLVYNFANGGYSESTGPFTQLVWKRCKSVGAGFAQSGSDYVVVACFEPPGNVGGKYDDNVKPLASDKKNPFHYY